jgi:hypothetical protein
MYKPNVPQPFGQPYSPPQPYSNVLSGPHAPQPFGQGQPSSVPQLYAPQPYAPQPFGQGQPYSAPQPYAHQPYSPPPPYSTVRSGPHAPQPQPFGQGQPYSAPQPFGQGQPYSAPQPLGQGQPYSAPQPFGQGQPSSAPQPYAPQPYAPQPYAPQPYAPQPFGQGQPYSAPQQYSIPSAPQQYSIPSAPQPYSIPSAPQPYIAPVIDSLSNLSLKPFTIYDNMDISISISLLYASKVNNSYGHLPNQYINITISDKRDNTSKKFNLTEDLEKKSKIIDELEKISTVTAWKNEKKAGESMKGYKNPIEFNIQIGTTYYIDGKKYNRIKVNNTAFGVTINGRLHNIVIENDSIITTLEEEKLTIKPSLLKQIMKDPRPERMMERSSTLRNFAKKSGRRQIQFSDEELGPTSSEEMVMAPRILKPKTNTPINKIGDENITNGTCENLNNILEKQGYNKYSISKMCQDNDFLREYNIENCTWDRDTGKCITHKRSASATIRPRRFIPEESFIKTTSPQFFGSSLGSVNEEPSTVKQSETILPRDSRPYKLFTTNDRININHITAGQLELKLNKTKYSRTWSELGNILHEWGFGPPSIYSITQLSYKVTPEQLEWIEKNL